MRPEVAALRALTKAAKGANYSVWDRDCERVSGLSRDVAIGYAMGLGAAGTLYGGHVPDPVVKCGEMVIWPEERWGEGASWATEGGGES